MTAAVSIQLTAEEAVFLFELMEIPESGQLMSDYGLSEDKLIYLAEGVKLVVDLDQDGEDDSVKDVVKYAGKQVWSTVSGWFK